VKNLQIKKVHDKKNLRKTITIRKKVFIKEQKVPLDIEIDGFDLEAEHFIAYFDDKPIGCARIRTKDHHAKLERIAIIKEYRGKGYGAELTKFLIDYCKQMNIKEIYLHSQIYVSDFYKKLGFKAKRSHFFEAGIEHVEMFMEINK
jgi:predicted GNAT family N-acyltransferase